MISFRIRKIPEMAQFSLSTNMLCLERGEADKSACVEAEKAGAYCSADSDGFSLVSETETSCLADQESDFGAIYFERGS